MNTEAFQSAATLSDEALRNLTLSALKEETLSLHDELEELISQKEKIARQIARKSDELQQCKYRFFTILEEIFAGNDEMLLKLHNIKIQQEPG